jgi:hypothetical protein
VVFLTRPSLSTGIDFDVTFACIVGYADSRFQSHFYLFGISSKVGGFCDAADSKDCCP